MDDTCFTEAGFADCFDLDGYGITDFEFDDLPPLQSDRPKYLPREYWETTDAERHFLDLPTFDSSGDRTKYFITQMAREALASVENATADDQLFEYLGEAVSLNQLLQIIDNLELNLPR